jgi:hypothetical protein
MQPAIQHEYARILEDEITRMTAIVGGQQMIIIVARRDLWEDDYPERGHDD